MERKCLICNKLYSSYKSLWNHTKIYHNNDKNINTKTTNIKNDSDKTHQNTSKNDNSIETVHTLSPLNTKNTKRLLCNYCNKIFSREDSLKRHIDSRCKIKNNKDMRMQEENKILKEELKIKNEKIEIFEKELAIVKEQMLQIMNKNGKVHPKTLNKINKQLNINGNITNNTINNTINIISLGNENLTETLNESDKKYILDRRYTCLNDMIKYIHFNDKFPQYKNILITNMQNNIAYKYDDKENKFMAVDKDDLLESVIDCRMEDITDFYEELEEKLDDRTLHVINDVFTKMEKESWDIYFAKQK